MSDKLQVSERIKEIRKDLNFSQLFFADILNVTRSHISKIETGKVTPSNQLIKSICRECGVRERWLREGQGHIYEKLDLTKFQQLKLDLEIVGYESAAQSFRAATISIEGAINFIKSIPGFKVKSVNQAAIKFLEDKKTFQKNLNKLQKLSSKKDNKVFRKKPF
jgi:transcriptional regulator with XRE-family HTH domain